MTSRPFFNFDGNLSEQHGDHVVRSDAFAVGVEGRHDAVTEHRVGDGFDVFGADVEATFQDGSGFGADNQVLPGSRSGSPGEVFASEPGSILFLRPRGADQVSRVNVNVLGHGYPAHDFLEGEDLLAGQCGFESRLVAAGGLFEDAKFLGSRRVVDHDVEHEAVQLRFGERVRSFLLDGILRGEDEERSRQPIGARADRHVPLLHCFEQGRLSFRWCPVDLIGEEDVCKQRSLHELERSTASVGVVLQNVGAGDVRWHEVRRELDSPVRQMKHL